MNRKLFGALAIAVLALVVNVNAQQPIAKANVPFSFDMGKKALPAGTYTISKLQPSSAILMRNAETWDSAIINVSPAQSRDAQSPKLVFHKYGNAYFLREVWYGSSSGMELPEPAREKEVRMASANGAAPQEVVVALR